eukprot:scaffold143_cov154-Amphora_coffeaeformis.AAC.11
MQGGVSSQQKNGANEEKMWCPFAMMPFMEWRSLSLLLLSKIRDGMAESKHDVGALLLLRWYCVADRGH